MLALEMRREAAQMEVYLEAEPLGVVGRHAFEPLFRRLERLVVGQAQQVAEAR
jgi:hypothetical protein